MKKTPVGPYSYAVLTVLKSYKEKYPSVYQIARGLHKLGFNPPIKPLRPVLEKLEAADLVERWSEAPGYWSIVLGAQYRLKHFTKTTADDLE